MAGALVLHARYRDREEEVKAALERAGIDPGMRADRLGVKDFISESPDQSVENILRYKDQYPPLQGIYSQAKDADLIVINGEGDLVFITLFSKGSLRGIVCCRIGGGISIVSPSFEAV